MEAARVPQRLLGELFVDKGLITPEELEEALADQKKNGKRLGEVLVKKGYVSGPALTTVLAEQLGVEMEKQHGYGSGLWSEIKRRHLAGRGVDPGLEPDAEVPEDPPEQNRRLALIDHLDGDPAAKRPVDSPPRDADEAELENLRQQLAFASNRLEEERAGHKGTLRLLEDSRQERERLADEVEDWRTRAAKSEDTYAGGEAAAERARLEESVARLEAELAAREQERGEAATARAKLESELETLRLDNEKAAGRLEKTRAEAGALETTVTELRAQLAEHKDAVAREASARTAVEEQLRKLESEHKQLSETLESERAEAEQARASLAAAVEVKSGLERRLTDRRERDRREAAAHRAEVEGLQGAIAERDEALADVAAARSAAEEQLAAVTADLASREDAFVSEAAARAAAEAELSGLRSDAEKLSARLEEERVAHGAARREAGRLESRCAELEPLEAQLAEATNGVVTLTQQVAELTAERDAAQGQIEALEAELAQRPEPPPVEEPPSAHVVYLPSAKGYSLAERPGPAPEVGAEEGSGGLRLRVVRVGRSPFPGDPRPCAFMEVA